MRVYLDTNILVDLVLSPPREYSRKDRRSGVALYIIKDKTHKRMARRWYPFFLCGLDVFVVFQAKNNRKKAF